MLRLFEPEIAKVASEGFPDERCSTCAFRRGTLPNGSPTTQMDVLKCIMEQVPFHCHEAHRKGELCHGWFAATYAEIKAGAPPKLVNWKFSDEYTGAEEEQKAASPIAQTGGDSASINLASGDPLRAR